MAVGPPKAPYYSEEVILMKMSFITRTPLAKVITWMLGVLLLAGATGGVLIWIKYRPATSPKLDAIVYRMEKLGLTTLESRTQTAGAHPLVKDRYVIRDEAYFGSYESSAIVEARLERYCAPRSKWDHSWIRWIVYDKREENYPFQGGPVIPEDYPTLVWIAVDTNVY